MRMNHTITGPRWFVAVLVGILLAVQVAQGQAVEYTPDVRFTLETTLAEGKMVFRGIGGEIDGVVNPDLRVNPGAVVQITLVNSDGVQHDIALPELNARSEIISARGSSTAISFRASSEGEFLYICTLPGHQAAGMEGRLVVGEVTDTGEEAPNISQDPANVPPPLARRDAQTVRVELETIELEGRLADGTSYRYWTFDGKVPGPFVRVREGDSVEVVMKNADDSVHIHSIDLHAVTGPGGGAEVTQARPGETKSFTFKALRPGLYVYHCATPMVAHHVTNGMYGLILVEPESGLPPVDREFYVMQGELYTQQAFGQRGYQEFSVDKLLDERPEYIVFNGATDALTAQFPMRAKVGERVRIYFGVGGPNLVSSFHVIGEIFEQVFDQGSLTTAPLTDVQTTLVPAGGSTMVEFTLDVPGRYLLVDHSLSRVERGLVGFLIAEGDERPEIFRPGVERAPQ